MEIFIAALLPLAEAEYSEISLSRKFICTSRLVPECIRYKFYGNVSMCIYFNSKLVLLESASIGDFCGTL